jgi:hypothetical protein
MTFRRPLGLLLLVCASAGCTTDDESTVEGPSPYTPAPLPPLESAPLTDVETVINDHPRLSEPDVRSPTDLANLQAMLSEGYGEISPGAGLPHVTHAPSGQTPPAPGPGAELLVRFAQLTDMHLVDDESPSRLANFDAPEVTDGASRPQEAYQCRIINAMVRTLGALHQELPLSFVLLTGDSIDNAQQNEAEWLLAVMGGADRVECDSGVDNDPTSGADNDPKDPFVADGLPVPWYWTTGNHDILRQGNVPINDTQLALALQEDSIGGTRNWAEPGGPLFNGPVPVDPSRQFLYPDELLALVAGDGDGHGLGDAQVSTGKAHYSFDVAGTSLRFVVVDTASETGSSDGLIRQGDLDSIIAPALDQSVSDDKQVVLVTHHSVASIGDGTGMGGQQQPDAVLGPAWTEFVGGYPNVLFSVVGHSHQHRLRHIEPTNGHGWWEVMASALGDFPSQGRIVEIWDQDNGWMMLRSTTLDYSTQDDPVAAEGRTLAVVDFVAGWADPGNVTEADINIEVWIEATP